VLFKVMCLCDLGAHMNDMGMHMRELVGRHVSAHMAMLTCSMGSQQSAPRPPGGLPTDPAPHTAEIVPAQVPLTYRN
jgi:hypothetical protein